MLITVGAEPSFAAQISTINYLSLNSDYFINARFFRESILLIFSRTFSSRYSYYERRLYDSALLGLIQSLPLYCTVL